MRGKSSPIAVPSKEAEEEEEQEDILSVSSDSAGVAPVQVLVSNGNEQEATGMKKPAASMKKPAKGAAVLKRPASLRQAWQPSLSLGMVKATLSLATKKAYIACKDSNGKDKYLVNMSLEKGQWPAT